MSQPLKPLLAQQTVTQGGDQPSYELVIIIQQLVQRVNELETRLRLVEGRIRLGNGP